MERVQTALSPLLPPAPPGPEHLFDWWPAPVDDPVAARLGGLLGDGHVAVARWECARLSKAAYVYRERATGRRYLAKFYAVKTPAAAERYAEREFECNQRALTAGLAAGPLRACHALAAWRGVLILEYVDGLTLDDVIAIRRNRPGTLGPALDATARLLARLHVNGAESPSQWPDRLTPPTRLAADARGFLDDLTRSSVLEGETVIAGALARLLDRWSSCSLLAEFHPTLIHGDATTTNFVFPSPDEVVAIDWERLAVGDPADDLGRLMAEVANGIRIRGGEAAEAEAAAERIMTAYRAALPDGLPDHGFGERLRFHRASSTLRMARNGWLSALERTRLVTEAMALLA